MDLIINSSVFTLETIFLKLALFENVFFFFLEFKRNPKLFFFNTIYFKTYFLPFNYDCKNIQDSCKNSRKTISICIEHELK